MPPVLRSIDSKTATGPRKPYYLSDCSDNEKLVYRIRAEQDPCSNHNAMEQLLKENYSGLIKGKKILIKFNLNTANPYPASVCPAMLRSLVDILHHLGAKEITVGDCCTISLIPTKTQVKKAGLVEALEGKAKIICFDETAWATVMIEGRYLDRVTVPLPALEAETIIALANLKTHQQAFYTGALKLAVGFMHPLERIALHREHLQEKIAEINLAIRSDLYLVDCRKVMITGGPDHGMLAPGKSIIAGVNPLAVDLAAYQLLYRLKQRENCLEGYSEDPFTLLQFKHAREIGLGGTPWKGYRIIDWESS